MDATDKRIIEQLRENARAGYAEIGDVVGLSASAVKRRAPIYFTGILRLLMCTMRNDIMGTAARRDVPLCRRSETSVVGATGPQQQHLARRVNGAGVIILKYMDDGARRTVAAR